MDGMGRFPKAPVAGPRLGGSPAITSGTGYPWVDGDVLYAADLNAAFALAAPLAALRYLNYVDNSGFSINQRNYVSGTALAAAAYGHDRWRAGASGCAYTFTAAPPAATITITAGTLQQVIEGVSIAGGNYMLSWTGAAQGRIGAGSYAASPVSVTGIAAGANTTIEFSTGTVGQVKLESGTVATQWFAVPIGYDLSNCQRFYQQGGYSLYGYNTAGQGVGYLIGLPVTMRAVPTVTQVTQGATNANGLTITGFTPTAVQVYANAAATGAMDVYGTFTASSDL